MQRYAEALRHHLNLIWMGLAVITALSSLVCYAELVVKVGLVRIPLAFFGMLGVPVGMLLVFRTNTAYDRWWEGRKLLGDLVNATRGVALRLESFLPTNAVGERVAAAQLLGSFARALAYHLLHRLGDSTEGEVEGDAVRTPPLHVLRELEHLMARAHRDGLLADAHLLSLQDGFVRLVNLLGACERIKTTRLPVAYCTHLKMLVFTYVALAPFGLAHEAHLGWWTVPISGTMFYMLEGIAVVGDSIEDPFGNDVHDLPVNDITRSLQATVSEIFGGDRATDSL